MPVPEPVPEPCHCGRPIYVSQDGFNRYMCEDCSWNRCDLALDPCPFDNEP